MSWQDWVLALVLTAGFGWAGSNDFDYRCDQAKKANPAETCKMIARGEKE